MMGRAGNADARCFWQADMDEAIGRLVSRPALPPDVMTTYNDFGGYGHPDHIRTHLVAVGAFDRAGDPAWYPDQLDPDVEPWSPAKLYEQAIPVSVRQGMQEASRRSASVVVVGARGRDPGAGRRVRGLRGEDARP